ncbi:MAG: hypothetical protein OIF50_01610 [Flavobacteriaceae bacterium]|nr:hypothetical protein [Flavobacteriaceae bacterium]
MKQFWFILFTVCMQFLWGQNPPLEVLQNRLDATTDFNYNKDAGLVFLRLKDSSSLTSFGTTYQQKSNKTAIHQLSKGGHLYALMAATQLKLEDSAWAFGKAFYKNGEKESIKWNETSDYHKIFPYVMADSIGGDLSFESYGFEGGYLKETNRLIWGLQAKYVAKTAYRTIDPRPKNTTSNMEAQASVSYKVNSKKIAALELEAKRYTQHNAVYFYNELGNPILYHFTGLGNHDNKLKGNKKTAYFKGNTFGAALHVVDRNKSGLFASVAYQYYQLKKTLPTFYNVEAANINQNQIRARLGTNLQVGNHHHAIALETSHRKRTGTESILFAASTLEYVKVGERQSYKQLYSNANLQYLYQYKPKENVALFAKPKFFYYQNETTFTTNFVQREVIAKGGELQLGMLYNPNKKSLLQIQATAIADRKSETNWMQKNTYADPNFTKMMHWNNAVLFANYTQYTIEAKYFFPLFSKSVLEIKLEGNLQVFDDFESNKSLQIGVQVHL